MEETQNASAISALPLNIVSLTVCLATARRTGAPRERNSFGYNFSYSFIHCCHCQNYSNCIPPRNWSKHLRVVNSMLLCIA
ncbi:hypothetical protein IMY05_003G0060700 [Salix suchowensis]|nr:hypothetical protein IMY05_003G0060700 [Salix suchowensis]